MIRDANALQSFLDNTKDAFAEFDRRLAEMNEAERKKKIDNVQHFLEQVRDVK